MGIESGSGIVDESNAPRRGGKSVMRIDVADGSFFKFVLVASSLWVVFLIVLGITGPSLYQLQESPSFGDNRNGVLIDEVYGPLKKTSKFLIVNFQLMVGPAGYYGTDLTNYPTVGSSTTGSYGRSGLRSDGVRSRFEERYDNNSSSTTESNYPMTGYTTVYQSVSNYNQYAHNHPVDEEGLLLVVMNVTWGVYGSNTGAGLNLSSWDVHVPLSTQELTVSCDIAGQYCRPFTVLTDLDPTYKYLWFTAYAIPVGIGLDVNGGQVTGILVQGYSQSSGFAAMEIFFRIFYMLVCVAAYVLFVRAMRASGISSDAETWEQGWVKWLFIGIMLLNNPLIVLEYASIGGFETFIHLIEAWAIAAFEVMFTFLFWYWAQTMAEEKSQDEVGLEWKRLLKPGFYTETFKLSNLLDARKPGIKIILLGVYFLLTFIGDIVNIVGWAEHRQFDTNNDFSTTAVFHVLAGIVYVCICAFIAMSLFQCMSRLTQRSYMVWKFLYMVLPMSTCAASILVQAFVSAITPVQRSEFGFTWFYGLFNAMFCMCVVAFWPLGKRVDGESHVPLPEGEVEPSESSSLVSFAYDARRDPLEGEEQSL